jgi:hypothetical protein
MDTLNDPFNVEVVSAVAFIVWFTPESEVLVFGTNVGAVVAFTVRLFVGARHPAATINPIAINRANSTIIFIRGFYCRTYDF